MPIKIPQYQQQVSPSHQGDTYLQTPNNPDAWGASLFKAQANLGESASIFFKNMNDIYDNILSSHALELSNYIDELDRTKLSDPNNGYFSKLGKDAMRKEDDPSSGAIGVLTEIDDLIKQKQKELGLTWGKGAKMAELVKTRKMNTMYQSATNHEFKQSQAYGNIQNNIAVDEALNKGIVYRNVPATREIALNNGKTAILNNARIQHFDSQTTQLQLNKFESDFHSAVVSSFLNDNSLEASEYFNKHKDKITAENQLKLQAAISHNELKYVSKSIANDLFTLYPDNEEKAVAELDKKNLKPDEYDTTLQNMSALYSQKRRLEQQAKSDAKKEFWDNAAIKIKNGEPVTLDDISDKLTGKDYIDARNALESLNKIGDIETNLETKTYLEYVSNYDAQRFKSLDLMQYRLNLSSDDYKALENRQQYIQKGDFFTIVKNNDSTRKYIAQITGLDENNEKVYNQYQNMLRAFEMREGRTATDIEKEQFLKYLGSDKHNYKLIEKQIKNGNEFYNGLANNIAYYQAHHNGEMPPDEIVNKWIKEQAVKYNNKKYSEIYNYSVNTVKPKQNEQLTLTQFADEFIPNVAKRIKANLKVTDRYRTPNGKYTSRHSEGRACDISYKTKDGEQLSLLQKENLWKDILNNPTVEKIAVSSADEHGKTLMKKFRRKYKDKIQDMNALDKNGKSRDENLNTDHTNHIHVTLYKDNTFKGVDKITIKNQLKEKGFSDEQISQYLLSKGY